MGRKRAHELPGRELDRLAHASDVLTRVETFDDLRRRVMETLHESYGFANTTFLHGATYRRAFADPTPVTTGRITPILDEYQDRWHSTDVFSLPTAFASLRRSRALNHEQLTRIPASARDYLQQFLYRHGLHSATVLHVHLPEGHHGLIGIFDDEDRQPSEVTLAALGRFACAVTETAAPLAGLPVPPWDAGLSPRLREVAELIIEGMSNDEIAAALVLSPDSVKTYVSRILTITETRSRTELVRLACMPREPTATGH